MSTPNRNPLTLAVAMALGLGTSQVVSAAEFTVTNTDDSGAGSLRAAVNAANSSGDASNTIVFDAGVTGTITLIEDILVENNSLTIQGPGPDVLTVEQDGRVLTLSWSAASVVISGLTLRHTTGSTTMDAPLFSHSPSLSIDNVHFRGESANVSNFGYGGGCLASSQWTSQPGGVTELSITNSEFDNCRSHQNNRGGAVFAEQSAQYGGDLRITIESTTMQNGFSGGGAAAMIRQQTSDGLSETSHSVTINGLVATDNANIGYDGTLTIVQGRDSSLDIDSLEMSGNSGAGALDLNAGATSTASIRNATFINNDTDFEPIAYINAFDGDVNVELVGTRISNSTGNASMGVEFRMVAGGHAVSIRDSLIHNSEFGIGAIGAFMDSGGYGGDTFEMVNTTITDNQVGNFALSVDPPSGTLDTDLRHVTITNNTIMGGLQPQDYRGLMSAPGMVILNADGDRRITNSVIQGVSVDAIQPRQGERGLPQPSDLSGFGAVTIDHSLIGTVDETNLTVTDAGGSDINNNTDPQLLELADNGGQSQTRAFTTDSPVFDAGNPGAADLPDFDQRGNDFPRNSGNAPDMGAFELQVAPAVSLDVEALAFPDTRVLTTADPLSVEVTNSGDFELNINDITASVVVRGAASFAADGSDCTAAAIPPGESCLIDVTFTPGSRDDFTGSLDIATDADPTPYSVSLSGTGIAPIIDVGPDRDFGTVLVGETSDPQTILIANTGDDTLEVTGFSPEVEAPFSLVFSDCGADLPFIVPAGSSCELSATFAPDATGNASATVTVQSDSLTGDASQFSLSGTGSLPGLGFEPLAFGDQLVNQSTQADLRLSNTGDGDLIIDNIALGATRGSVFNLIGDDCDTPVVPGEFCTVTIGFTPPAEGEFTSTLNVSSNSGSESAQVPISGRGVIGRLAISPSGDIDFGDVGLGESGETELTLTNEGSAPLTVEDWNDLPAPFSISGDCPEPPFTIDPDESCTLIITFSPESAGDYEQGITLGFNDGTGSDSTQVAVSGRGTVPIDPAVPVPMFDRVGLLIGGGLLALAGLLGLRRRERRSPLS